MKHLSPPPNEKLSKLATTPLQVGTTLHAEEFTTHAALRPPCAQEWAWAATSCQRFSLCMKNKPTGGKRLASLIECGIPFRVGLWLDTYNGIYNTAVSGTIKARIDSNCMYFVTQVYETP